MAPASVPGYTRSLHRISLGAIFLLSGCNRLRPNTSAFAVQGSLASSGGALERWSHTPTACTRDSFLGADVAQPPMLATFLWVDPSPRSIRPDLYRRFGPETPLRLAVVRKSPGPALSWAALYTMKHSQGIRIDPTLCRTFTLTAQERPNAIPAARPTLEGELTLDCTVQGSHITANLRFSGCGF